jgi:hypothetical protein
VDSTHRGRWTSEARARLAVAAAVVLSSGIAATSATQGGLAERAATAALEAPAGANAVWPGFSLRERNWLIYDDDGAALWTPGLPPAEFTRRGRIYYRAGKLPGLVGNLNLSYRLGDLRVAAIHVGPTLPQTLRTLYHEAFHAFQNERFIADDGSGRGIVAITPAQAASIEIERSLLSFALARKQPDNVRRQFVHEALAIRAQRSANAAELAAAERRAERNEGLAEYVGLLSAARASGRPDETVAEEIATAARRPLRLWMGSPDERLIRIRAYATGAAMGLLLDLRGVDWKRRADSEPLDVLLAEAFALPSSGLDVLAADALRAHFYDKLVADPDPSWGTLVTMSEAEFETLGSYRLVLDLPISARPAWSLSIRGGGAPSGMHRPTPDVLLLPSARQFTVQDEKFSLTATNRPVRMEVDRAQARGRYTILLDELPTLDGAALRDGTVEVSRGRIEARGVSFTFSGAATVERTAAVVRFSAK